MIEKQSVNGKEVWIKVDPYPVERKNPNIIPTEYFTATCYTNEPRNAHAAGDPVRDEDGNARLFESPVAALSYARKMFEHNTTGNTEEQQNLQTQQEQKETD